MTTTLTSPDEGVHHTFSAAHRHAVQTRRLARLVLAAFIVTFAAARITVMSITNNKLPQQLYLHVNGTHVHHLNYGIFLLSAIGATLIFLRPTGRYLTLCSIVYGIGLGLTFDEFGMLLHLGGGYWQRASYDAVVIVGAVLALIAFGSHIRNLKPRHYITSVSLATVLILFGYASMRSVRWAHHRLGPKLSHLDERSPS
jgi:hypothetical protein